MKHFFHIVAIPMVGLLTAKKSIARNPDKFYLNESFATWLVMMIFGGFSSTFHWYYVVGVNIMCFAVYIAIVFKQYGLDGIGNDFYVHIPTIIIYMGCLVKMNEVNLRSSFALLSQSKV